jgi:hypothetical protein
MKRKSRWAQWKKVWEAKTRPVHLRVDPDTSEELKAYAKKEKISSAEAVRRFITWGLDISA